MKKKLRNTQIIFDIQKLTLKVRILKFLTTFTQLTARLKNFLRGWLLVSDLNEGLVECATVCVKSEVILVNMLLMGTPSNDDEQGKMQKSDTN